MPPCQNLLNVDMYNGEIYKTFCNKSAPKRVETPFGIFNLCNTCYNEERKTNFQHLKAMVKK